jgi:hypothetical protein
MPSEQKVDLSLIPLMRNLLPTTLKDGRVGAENAIDLSSFLLAILDMEKHPMA